MKIIKRNGAEAAFDISKIESAITRANAAVAEQFQMTATGLLKAWPSAARKWAAAPPSRKFRI